MGALIGAERAADSIEMARIVFGAESVRENPVLYCVSNTNAPLVLDANMSGVLKTYARAGQPVACTPWTLAGAMSPCTVAGTLAQILAEALASLCQAREPGEEGRRTGYPDLPVPGEKDLPLPVRPARRRAGFPSSTALEMG